MHLSPIVPSQELRLNNTTSLNGANAVNIALNSFSAQNLIAMGMNIDFLGPLLPDEIACGVADGLLDPFTRVYHNGASKYYFLTRWFSGAFWPL